MDHMHLSSTWKKYLKEHGVKLPKPGTIGNNVLCVLYDNLNEWVTKKQICELINYTGNDLQHPRHLHTKGWHIISNYKSGPELAYKLVTAKKPIENWNKNRRDWSGNWNDLKSKYDHRCASCGSKENEPHLMFNHITVKLEKGHINPNLSLTDDNCIPQCSVCNKGYRDKWIFDKNGKIAKINFESKEIKKLLKREGYVKKDSQL